MRQIFGEKDKAEERKRDLEISIFRDFEMRRFRRKSHAGRTTRGLHIPINKNQKETAHYKIM